MLFYVTSHRKIASQFFSVTTIEENHRCDAIAIPGFVKKIPNLAFLHFEVKLYLKIMFFFYFEAKIFN